MGGSKKKNGHRKNCKCPICKNMNNSKRRGGNSSLRKTRKIRGGEGDEETKTSDDETEPEEIQPYDDEDTDSDEDADTDSAKNTDAKGGKRRSKKRGNGHKPSCECPICKNMKKKAKKGGSDPMEVKASDTEYEEMDDADRGATGGSRRKRRRTRKYRK